MTPPRIIELQRALFHEPDLFDGLPAHVATGSTAFAVVRSGTFAGRWFERGEVLVCGAGWDLGQAVVLIARTQGRPRLGHVLGSSFSGDRGEACSTERWMPAGGLRHVWRHDGVLEWARQDLTLTGPGGWLSSVVPVHEVGASWRDQRWSSRGGTERPPQLSLFAEAA